MATPPIAPEEIPVFYKNIIEDLLLAILNTLPRPNNDPTAFLNGQYNWAIPPGGVGGALPNGNTTGDVLVWLDDGINPAGWAVYQRNNLLLFDEGTNHATVYLEQTDSIKFGPDLEITGSGTGQVVLKSGSFRIEQSIELNHDLSIQNKAQTAYINFATRDITGAEAKMKLQNVKSLNDVNADDAGVYGPGRMFFTRNGTGYTGSMDAQDFVIKTNNTARLVFKAGGGLEPNDNAVQTLGTTTKRFTQGWFSDFVQAGGFTTGGNVWTLGGLTAGAGQTLNTNQYITVTIGGVTYKLATLN